MKKLFFSLRARGKVYITLILGKSVSKTYFHKKDIKKNIKIFFFYAKIKSGEVILHIMDNYPKCPSFNPSCSRNLFDLDFSFKHI